MNFVRINNLTLLIGCGLILSSVSMIQAADVRIVTEGNTLSAYVGNQLFFTYHTENAAKPYLYPIYAPDNHLMVRNYPMVKVDGEETDHPHQKAFWFTHGDINGTTYWEERTNFGKIFHQNFVTVRTETNKGTIETLNYWIPSENAPVDLKDQRTLVFYGDENANYLDFTVTLTAIGQDKTFGDTKEGTFGIRIAESMRVKGGLNQGHIINSNGQKDGATWGQQANWVDYYGPVNGDIMGITVMEHPQSFRAPTWWHVRDYGLFAANPFGIHDFVNEFKDDKTKGNFVLPKDQSISFKYKIIFHKGAADVKQITKEYNNYAQSKQ